jgi:hypothetical protein
MGSAKFTFPEHPIVPNIHRTGDGFHGRFIGLKVSSSSHCHLP